MALAKIDIYNPQKSPLNPSFHTISLRIIAIDLFSPSTILLFMLIESIAYSKVDSVVRRVSYPVAPILKVSFPY